MGVTSPTFRKSGNIPLLKDNHITYLNSVLNSSNIFVGMLMGPALFDLMQLIRDSMSAEVVGGKKDSFISSLSKIM